MSGAVPRQGLRSWPREGRKQRKQERGEDALSPRAGGLAAGGGGKRGRKRCEWEGAGVF